MRVEGGPLTRSSADKIENYLTERNVGKLWTINEKIGRAQGPLFVVVVFGLLILSVGTIKTSLCKLGKWIHFFHLFVHFNAFLA